MLPDDQKTSVLNMKPVSCQSMPPSVSGGHPNVAMDHVLNTSNVMYCEKCGFASADAAAFKKHMIEHLGTRFYCFYCNSVSFSEAELNAHLKQHAAKYPFKCPHCGQGYMRRLCLVKHIERLHSKSNSQGPAKSGMTKNSHVALSSALPSVPTADPSPVRPTVRVTVPTPSTPLLRLGKEEQRGKQLDTNMSNVTNRNAEHLSPLNGLIHHNRALTVSLPDEVTIPAGCLVELVEVKTVNGTKELKLRLITQQENESVIKDTRTTVSQGGAPGKPLSSTLNHPNTVNSMSMGVCTVNRKQSETVNVERPPAVSVSAPKNIPTQVSTEKVGFKRASPEIINLECNAVIPKKVPKTILNLVREGTTGIRIAPREAVNLKAAAPTVMSTRVSNRLTGSLHPENMGTGVNLKPEHSKGVPPRRASDTKTIPPDAAVPVKLEPAELHVRNSVASKSMKETVSLNQQTLKSSSPSVSVSLAADVQVRLPTVAACKDDASTDPSFPSRRTLNKPPSVKTPVLSNQANSKVLAWPHEVQSNVRAGEGDMPEPEGFPVISSVFSLSQQPEEVQGSIQPLVMALRGIVMDKNNSSCSATQDQISIINRTEQVKEVPKAEVDTKSRPGACDPLAEKNSDRIKVEEHDKGIQHPPTRTLNHVHMKEEKSSTKATNDNKCSHVPAAESSRDEAEAPSNEVSDVDVSVAADSLQTAKSERDICSLKFPTVSLKRVQVGVWKKSNKGLKLRISKYKTQVPVGSVTDCTVIYPMPLKVNQLVTRPGPYQPVVVLNHPKPRAPVQGARADSVADTGASGVVPKCQILKMRLSKVMGQKYEVMGCTVRVFP